jgi:membrane-associated phospholipid phosphatase
MLTNHRRALLYASGLLTVTVLVFVLVGFDATRPAVQAVDDVVYGGAEDIRNAPLTVVARVLNVLGGGWVLIPLRIVVAAFLAVRQRWRALTTWLLIWLVAEVGLVVFKAWYARPRPPDGLVGTKGFSFPSGHAVATAATAIALVLVLLPAGRKRRRWEVYAALFSFAMALSRVYLNAHWFSDVVAGTLLGAGIALTVAGMVTEVRDVAIRRRERLAVPG